MTFKTTTSVTFFFFLCMFLYTLYSIQSIQIDYCRTQMIQRFPTHYYMVNNSIIKSTEFVTTVYSINNACILDVEQLLQPYGFGNVTTEVAMIHLDCMNNAKILFNLTEIKTFPNIIGYFTACDCSFESENVLQFLKTLNFRVLAFCGLFMDSFSNQELKSSVLDKIVSLSVMSPKIGTIKAINDLFGNENIYQNMAEIFISDSRVAINLTTFKSRFPKLQSLEITYSTFEALNTFLWTNNNISYLPDGFWRSKYLQDHYVNVLHVDIPGNVFRRSLQLSHCNISDLSQIQLKGIIYLIDLNSNRIDQIRRNTFYLVSGLQSLVLKSNRLSNISEGAFNRQQSMTYLDLSENLLSNMSATVFSTLQNLKQLNLANNIISNLPNGIFAKLYNLEMLRLDNNLLFMIGSHTLPSFSIKLHSIFINNNPLNVFPVSCFYIRSLKIIELKNTQITFDNVTSILQNIDLFLLLQINVNLLLPGHNQTKTREELRTVDLTGSKVRSFQTSAKLSDKLQHKMIVLLKRFRFVLKKNPLTCDCNIIPVTQLMKNFTISGTFTGNEYFFKEWTCKHPRQFEGKPMLLLKDGDTYCEINDTFCPLKCKCYQRYNRNVTIVDCFESGLDDFPKQLPRGIIDLWISNNNISTMPWRDYFKYVQWLDVSNNRLSKIQNSVFTRMSKLIFLNLNNNKLSYLPISIKHLNLHSISVKDNLLRCDCHSLWTKHWLLSNLNIIKNVKSITCLEDHQQPIVSTPDKDFICLTEKEVLNMSILIPALAAVFVSVIFVLLLCVYRFEIKVLLYIYCGLHPFDKLTGCRKETIDYIVVYSKEDGDFVLTNVITGLQKRGYSLLDIHEHFLAGYSFHDNITSAVEMSKHVLIILSEEMLNNSKLLNIVWTECQNKIEKYRANFVILACHDLKRSKIQNKAVTRYLKQNRFLDTRSALFLDKVSYYLPKKNSQVHNTADVFRSVLVESRCIDRTTKTEFDIFISYTDEDRDILSSTFNAFENDGYKLCLPDRDFLPGAPMPHNIVDSISKSMHTVLVTRGFMYDEEICVYRVANEKSAQCKYNHLIVIFSGNDTNISLEDKDVEKYLGSYVTLRLFDPHFLVRLKSSLLFSTMKQ